MTPTEKIQYVKDMIDEKVAISPKGSRYALSLYTVTEYEEGPTLISRNEQHSIFKRFEQDRYIKNVWITQNGTRVSFEKDQNDNEERSSIDYVVEALNFFKGEYNKVRIKGLTYEYKLGINFAKSDYEPNPDEVNHAYYRQIAIERLKEIGFVTEFKIDERVVDDYGNIDDYAICKIDESKLIKEEAPEATNAGVQDVAEKVIKYEHVHRFENSIQEKAISLSFEQEKAEEKQQIKLSNYQLSFDDESAQLLIGDYTKVSFPPHKNEHYVMRKLFSHKKSEVVDWQEVYEAMTHTKSDTTNTKEIEKQKKSVKDAVIAINERVKSIAKTENNLLLWKLKTIKRLY